MKKGNLLIVDDEELILENLELMLEELPDKIFLAVNGIDALRVLEENTIHCILCDINMPKMDGVEFIKEVRNLNNDVPFIFYTGHGNSELMMEAIKYGAFDFLHKPNLDGVLEVVGNGLFEGFNKRKNDAEPESTAVHSEYQELLKSINENAGKS